MCKRQHLRHRLNLYFNHRFSTFSCLRTSKLLQVAACRLPHILKLKQTPLVIDCHNQIFSSFMFVIRRTTLRKLVNIRQILITLCKEMLRLTLVYRQLRPIHLRPFIWDHFIWDHVHLRPRQLRPVHLRPHSYETCSFETTFMWDHIHLRPRSFETTFIWDHIHLSPYSFETTFIWDLNHLRPHSFETTVIWEHIHLRPHSFETTFIWDHNDLRPHSFETTFIWDHIRLRPQSFETTFILRHVTVKLFWLTVNHIFMIYLPLLCGTWRYQLKQSCL